MKTIMLYRPHSDHERKVLDYLRDYAMQTGRSLPTLDADSVEGAHLCSMYDIVQFPAIIVTADDDTVQNMWSGDMLPLISEVSYYSRNV